MENSPLSCWSKISHRILLNVFPGGNITVMPFRFMNSVFLQRIRNGGNIFRNQRNKWRTNSFSLPPTSSLISSRKLLSAKRSAAQELEWELLSEICGFFLGHGFLTLMFGNATQVTKTLFPNSEPVSLWVFLYSLICVTPKKSELHFPKLLLESWSPAWAWPGPGLLWGLLVGSEC